jgi:hypothetical protein
MPFANKTARYLADWCGWRGIRDPMRLYFYEITPTIR